MSYYMSQQSAPSPDGYDVELNALSRHAPAPPQNSKQLSMYDMGVCWKTSNNKYPDCPALMDDGRAFTDYRPSCYINDLIRIKNGIVNSYDYRQFLIHNATNLMDTVRLYNIKKNGCRPCDARPVLCNSLCSVDRHAVSCKPYDCAGIGNCNVYNPAPQMTVQNYNSVPRSWCSLNSGC